MTAPLIYFIRHGQTDWNAEMRLQGQQDIALNVRGRDQARRNGGVLAELLDEPERFDFLASPLQRVRETMEIVRGQLGLPVGGYIVEARLREIAFGDWEGWTWTELAASVPDLLEARAQDPFNFRPPGDAETYGDVTCRLVEVYNALQRDTVIVSHGGVSRCIRGHVLGLSEAEIPQLPAPQDKVMRIRDGKIDWI